MRTRKRTGPSASRFGKLAVWAAIAAMSGCITVNVNFPESAVQRAADDFVKDLYNDKSASAAPAAAPIVKAKGKRGLKKRVAAPPSPTSGLEFGFFAAALAADVEPQAAPNFHTPDAEKIIEQIRPLVPEIKKYKALGVFGETLDGDLVIKDAAKADARARELEKKEKSLRRRLYEIIADDNHASEKVIRKTMSKSFRDNSPPGTWIEDESGWQRKK